MNKYKFSGIFIPAHIWENKSLSWMAKSVYGAVANMAPISWDKSADEVAAAMDIAPSVAWQCITDLTGAGHLNVTGGANPEWLAPTGVSVAQAPAPQHQAPAASPDLVAKVLEAYHKYCPTMPKVREVTSQRMKNIRARFGDSFSPDVFIKAGQSDMLCGRNKLRWQMCNIDWILKPTNFQSILEGKYDNADNRQFSTSSLPDRY
jgi:hypothetical protein